jgi:hypothetical protein
LQVATLRRAQTAAGAVAGNVIYQNPWEVAAALGLDVSQFGRETLRHPRWTAQQRRSGPETFDVWPEDYLDELGKRPVFSPGELSPLFSSFSLAGVFREEDVRATRLVRERVRGLVCVHA